MHPAPAGSPPESGCGSLRLSAAITAATRVPPLDALLMNGLADRQPGRRSLPPAPAEGATPAPAGRIATRHDRSPTRGVLRPGPTPSSSPPPQPVRSTQPSSRAHVRSVGRQHGTALGPDVSADDTGSRLAGASPASPGALAGLPDAATGSRRTGQAGTAQPARHPRAATCPGRRPIPSDRAKHRCLHCGPAPAAPSSMNCSNLSPRWLDQELTMCRLICRALI